MFARREATQRGKLVIPALMVALLCGSQSPALAAKNDIVAVPVAPQGVTIQSSGNNQRGDSGSQSYFSDSRGMTLYHFSKDGKPAQYTCKENCAYLPFVAPKGAKASGRWSTVKGAGGTQWALDGHALYTSTKDEKIGDLKGVDKAAGWLAAEEDFGHGIAVPVGVQIAEAVNAGGYAFVDDHGMPLYTFAGDAMKDKNVCLFHKCEKNWNPLAASQLSMPAGDFSVINNNGMYQWAYKGHPLYTYTGDFVPGDATGSVRDSRFQILVIARHFVPEGLKIAPNHFGGFNFFTDKGMAVYQRARWRGFNTGKPQRIGTRDDPATGRFLGLSVCEGDCMRDWKPVKAPADAQPTGYWDVVARPDGTKQWAYKGYILFTYNLDNAPGEMNGNDLTEYMPLNFGDPFKKVDDFESRGGRRVVGAGAMTWHITIP